ncbi:Kinesin heavy chain [Gryllus bimaculatus]|nr:Kinesin heavy chain [Gryllus bimaculatus]
MSEEESDRELAAEDNIKVMCRFRPLNDREKEYGSTMMCKFADSINFVYWGQKLFTFDKVFKPETHQETVYDEAARTIVTDVLSGFNGTVFAYGQTSSGKTHTMEGDLHDPGGRGIIPRIVDDIFHHIYYMDEDLEFHIKVSYFEIYMEKIRDLLDITKINLTIHEDRNRVPFVKGLTERFVSNRDDVFNIIAEGKTNRHFAVTDMNEHSSRSHCVFSLTVRQENLENQKILVGKLYLVDLAGSEKVSKTGAEGTVLEEAKYINKSLSSLGNVIKALSDGKSYIPYRDSKLTRVLQESLGGNSRTTVIICCSPASFNQSETKSTLEFGIRAKTVKNVVCVNEEVTAEEWESRYRKEVENASRLKAKLRKLESELTRWRSGDTVPAEDQISLQVIDASRAVALSRTTFSRNEREFLHAERDSLYKQLDEKDEEINQQGQLVDILKDEMLEQEDLIASARRRYDLLQRKMNRVQRENDSAKEEMKEVLIALEELAVNYDLKSEEFELKNKEYENLAEELTKKQLAFNVTLAELQQLKDMSAHQRKRIAVMLTDLLKDLREIGVAIGGVKNMNVLTDNERKIEDDFAVARLYTSKMKSEVQNLVQRCNTLEGLQAKCNKKQNEYEKELTECRMIINQHEGRVKILQESMREAEERKRVLEEDFDTLKDECVKKKATECTQKTCTQEEPNRDAETNTLREEFEVQIKLIRDAHLKQVANLREEITEKQAAINELRNKNHKYCAVNQQLQKDYERFKQEECKKSVSLQELVMNSERQETARRDLKGLEDTVARELQTLHNLRKLFVQDLQSRIEESADVDESGDYSGCLAQKQTIKFLESNLDQLTRVNRQLVRDNADLRCELPKLERRLSAAMDRVRALETALRDSKDTSLDDRKKRYLNELDRIKETIRMKSLGRRKPSAQIAKPIRTGHHPNQHGSTPRASSLPAKASTV